MTVITMNTSEQQTALLTRMLSVMTVWKYTCVYIAVILTLSVVLHVAGVF